MPANTPIFGFPYPLGTDPVSQGDNDIRALAEDVETVLATNGLWLVKTQTIGSGVSSVTVTDAFSADYDNYLVTYTGGVGSTSTFLKMTLGSTTANYYYAVNGHTYANAAANSGSANVAFLFGGWITTVGGPTEIVVINPQKADRTEFYMRTVIVDTSGGIYHGGGYLNDTTAYTAFTFTPNAGTITGGTIRVYGYSN